MTMPNIQRRQLIAGALAGAALPACGWAQSSAPDLLLRNGRIWTGVPSRPFVQALAIRHGLIVAVGYDAEVLGHAGKSTRVIDLEGRLAMPGINDTAPFGTTANTARPPMADPPLFELVAALKKTAAKAPSDGWICASAGASVMSDPVGTRRAIDRELPTHPVMLTAWWGHGVILSSRGLMLLGVTDATNDPSGGRLDRDANGHLTGRLEEYAGFAAARDLVSHVRLAARAAALQAYAKQRLSEGVTSVQVMATAQPLDMMRDTVVAAQVPLRLRILRFPMPEHESLQARPEQQWTALARSSGVKYVLDGTPIEQGAFESSDYPGTSGWRGKLNFDPRFIEARLRTALSSGEQLAFHAVGDATAGVLLDLMERLAPAERWRALRLRIEHANGITGSTVDRARALGIVIAQFRPTAPLKIWRQAGLPLAYGSDGGFPAWSTLQAMTETASPGTVDMDQALGILTFGSAFAEFKEESKGRIGPGMAADIAVLSQDVTRTPAEQLSSTKSLLTIVAGKTAHAESPFL
jgi:predicted amidohydrolase YtcJ